MVDQREWTVPCIDAVGRLRRFTVRACAAGVVLGFPPAGSATISPHRARALAMTLALVDQTTAGAVLAGGERTAGVPGGASKFTTRPAVPEPAAGAADARFAAPAVTETSVGPGRALVSGPTGHHRGDAR